MTSTSPGIAGRWTRWRQWLRGVRPAASESPCRNHTASLPASRWVASRDSRMIVSSFFMSVRGESGWLWVVSVISQENTRKHKATTQCMVAYIAFDYFGFWLLIPLAHECKEARNGDQRGQHSKSDCVLRECRFPAGSDSRIEILFCSLYEIGDFRTCG
jgi:hypothetical protein